MLSRQRGVTLVELMISLGLSLFLILVVAQFFVANKTTYRTQQAQADIQERGRYAISWIARQLRHTGYVDVTRVASAVVDSFPAGGGLAAGQVLAGTASSVTVRYWGAVDGDLVNCLGASIASGVSVAETIDLNGTDLRCQGTSVLRDIRELVFSYGEDSGVDGVPDVYRAVPTDWLKVNAVRICLLVESRTMQVSPGPQTITRCDGVTSYTPPDNRIARLFHGAVYLRNVGSGR